MYRSIEDHLNINRDNCVIHCVIKKGSKSIFTLMYVLYSETMHMFYGSIFTEHIVWLIDYFT